MLYAHQEKIVKEDKPVAGLWLGTGSGKTLTALHLARGKVLVIAPKTQKEDQNWERELEANNIGLKLTVISKETFRRDWDLLPKFDTIIGDEAHTLLGVTPNIRYQNKKAIPKTSQLFEALLSYIQKHKPERIYMATATIMRSPMTVWGAAKVLGKDWNFYEFRDIYYTKLPMPGREVWVPKSDSATKDRLAKCVQKLGYVGRLEDFFDVPDQTYKTIFLEPTVAQAKRMKELPLEYPDPLVLLGKRHQIENGVLAGDEYSDPETFDNQKIEKIEELALEFPKMVVFAKYRHQISEIERVLSENYRVLTLTGDTKDRGEVISRANKSDQCIFICQAQISAGWELPDFPVMVFASMSYSIVDRVQAEGRILRANALKKNLYIDLVVKGGIDEAVYKSIKNKKDFNERLYLNL